MNSVKLALQFSLGTPGIATTLIGIGSEQELRHNVDYAESAVEFDLFAEVRALLKPPGAERFTRGRAEHRDAVLA